MIFSNTSGCEAGWTAGYERDGRELLIVIVKATYVLPADGEPLAPAEAKVQLVQADEFTGEPGLSAPLYETDYAHRKPGCDVLLVGSAHAPAGTQVTRSRVGLKVGSMVKQFTVVGDREWHKGPLGVTAGEPRPFTAMPLSYDNAFGGTDSTDEARSGQTHSYRSNPVGRGYWKSSDEIDGKPLPNTEQMGHPVTHHDGGYVPMAFTPIGRAWLPRAAYAGTYDQAWQEHQAPFWPDDFDYRYFQAAPPDQVMAYPQGGEEVELRSLTPSGLLRFRLPERRMPVTFIPHRGKDVTRQAMLDTIVIEPDAQRLTLTWRSSLALGKSVFDVKETVAGEMSQAWYRAQRFPGKVYYPGLGEAVAARQVTSEP